MIIQHSWPNPLKYNLQSQVDLCFCDPPYNFGINYSNDETKDIRWNYYSWCRESIKEIVKCLRPGATFWWLCPPAHMDFIGLALTELVGPRLYCIVKRESFAQYQQTKLTEDYRLLYCHVKGDGPLTFNPNSIRIPSDRQLKYKDKRANAEGRVPGQVWDIRRLQGTSDDHVDWHPAQLPPELLDRIILGWSNKNNIVMDAFAGSGSMAVSAKKLERAFIGTEQSQFYVDKIKERLV